MTFNSHCLTSRSIAQGWHTLKCVAMATLCLCHDVSIRKNVLKCLRSHDHYSSESGSPRHFCGIEMWGTSTRVSFLCCMALHSFFVFGCWELKQVGILVGVSGYCCLSILWTTACVLHSSTKCRNTSAYKEFCSMIIHQTMRGCAARTHTWCRGNVQIVANWILFCSGRYAPLINSIVNGVTHLLLGTGGWSLGLCWIQWAVSFTLDEVCVRWS